MSAKLPLICLLSLLGSGCVLMSQLLWSQASLKAPRSILWSEFMEIQVIAKQEPFVQLHLLYYYDY